MSEYLILFNPLADNGHGAEEAEKLNSVLEGNKLEFRDITKVEDWKALLETLPAETKLLICGGDGTVNKFINLVYDSGAAMPAEVYYYATGSGNDFLTDIGGKKGDAPTNIAKYLVDLPTAEINGKTYRYINGIGFGIDGYCCEEADRLKTLSDKPVNYTAIAIKGMLGAYSPRNAKITVDGKVYNYKKVWLAPMMNGRYFGGGMMPTPNQDRLNSDRKISMMIFCGRSRLLTLIKFPKIFSGAHLKFKAITIYEGSDMTVEYDRPTALQVDGETIVGVTVCRCRGAKVR